MQLKKRKPRNAASSGVEHVLFGRSWRLSLIKLLRGPLQSIRRSIRDASTRLRRVSLLPIPFRNPRCAHCTRYTSWLFDSPPLQKYKPSTYSRRRVYHKRLTKVNKKIDSKLLPLLLEGLASHQQVLYVDSPHLNLPYN